MSSYSLVRRTFVVATVLALSAGSRSFAADPKVVKASHEAAAKAAPRVISDSDDVPQEDTGANTSVPSYSPQWPAPPDTGAMLVRLCGGTVAALGICVIVLWLGKPWLKRLQITGSGNASFTIEGSVAVGNRAMLYLVRVGETQLVAGTDATGLKSLIALPLSFKDVLEEQLPVNEAPAVPAVPSPPLTSSLSPSSLPPLPFDLRSLRRPDPKE